MRIKRILLCLLLLAAARPLSSQNEAGSAKPSGIAAETAAFRAKVSSEFAESRAALDKLSAKNAVILEQMAAKDDPAAGAVGGPVRHGLFFRLRAFVKVGLLRLKLWIISLFFGLKRLL